MLTDLPWPQVLLGLAAALGLVVIYDVCYVWPIHRRLAAVAARCAVLERSLGGVLDDLVARFEANANQDRADLSRLGKRLGQLEVATDTRSYEQAIGCAERGEETARLISCFGLTEGEADLVMLLHGEASRRAAVAKFAGRLIDTAHV